MSSCVKQILTIALFLSVPAISFYAKADSSVPVDIDTASVACQQAHAEVVNTDILNAGYGNDCTMLAPVGNTFSKNCNAHALAPYTSACGYTFYTDRTVLACKMVPPNPAPSDDTVYKYVLCRGIGSEHRVFWVRFMGKLKNAWLPKLMPQSAS